MSIKKQVILNSQSVKSLIICMKKLLDLTEHKLWYVSVLFTVILKNSKFLPEIIS